MHGEIVARARNILDLGGAAEVFHMLGAALAGRDLPPGFMDAYLEAAGRSGRMEQALTALLGLTRSRPGDLAAQAGLLRCLLALGHTREAALAADGLAASAARPEVLADFLASLRGADGVAPDWLAARYRNLATMLAAAGRPDAGSDLLERACAELGRPWELPDWLAGLALSSNQPDAALRLWGQALALAPDHAPSLAGMAQALLALSRAGDAEELLDKALRLVPGDERLLDLSLRCAVALGEFSPAFTRWRAWSSRTCPGRAVYEALLNLLLRFYSLRPSEEVPPFEREAVLALAFQADDPEAAGRMPLLAARWHGLNAVPELRRRLREAARAHLSAIPPAQANLCAAVNILAFDCPPDEAARRDLLLLHLRRFAAEHFYAVVQVRANLDLLHHLLEQGAADAIPLTPEQFAILAFLPAIAPADAAPRLEQTMREQARRRFPAGDLDRPGAAFLALLYGAARPEQVLGSGDELRQAYLASALPRALGRPERPPAAIARRERPLRIACCVSGQLRGFRQAFPTWSALGLDGHAVDFYVHAWRAIGLKPPVSPPGTRCLPGHLGLALRGLLQSNPPAALIARYPAFYRHFLEGPARDQATVAAEELESFYGARRAVVEDDAAPPFAAYTNPMKMYYKIWACHRLMEESGERYDLVLRLRPDKTLLPLGPVDWPALLADVEQSDALYADGDLVGFQPLAGLAIGDQFAAADPQRMGVYASAWRFTPLAAARRLAPFPAAFQGHVNLTFMTFLHGIRVKAFRAVRFGPLLEYAALTPAQARDLLAPDLARGDEMDEVLAQALDRDLAGPNPA